MGLLGQIYIWFVFLPGQGVLLERVHLQVNIRTSIDISNGQPLITTTGPDTTSSKQSSKAMPDISEKQQALRTRIVGGKEAIPHSLPWQVAIINVKIGMSACGGTILAPKFIMTAGHCTHRKEPSSYQVWAGAHDLTTFDGKGVGQSGHTIAKFHNNPNYRYHSAKDYADYDFSILELEQPIVFRDSAKALFLPDPEDDKRVKNQTFVVSGWGRTSFPSGPPSIEKLLTVTVPWISDSECRAAYDGEEMYVKESMVCAGDTKSGGIDACIGDSGGPMAWLDPDSDEVKLVGVVSFGKGCADPKFPGVFGEISHVLDWVKKIIGTANEDACNQGHCMTKSKLRKETIQDFQKVTPHTTNTTVLTNKLEQAFFLYTPKKN